MSEKKVSIIIPAYNEQDNIERTYQAIDRVLKDASISYECIFINDGSKDNTYAEITKLAVSRALSETDSSDGFHGVVKGLSFSRNFGKEAAIFAGLEASSGDCCIIMDCDLQHPAELLPQMVSLWNQGYEVVEGIKSSRGKESFLHRLSANTFYAIISSVTKLDMANASDFKLLDRKAVEALLAMPERAPFFRALSSWIGFNTITIPFEVQERVAGSSKWSAWSLIKYALHNITSFSGAPMQFVTIMGWIMLLGSLVLAIQSLYRYFSGTAVEGFTTVILLQLIIGSVLMISLGIIGHYISRIYNEIKARPRYIISRKCGF